MLVHVFQGVRRIIGGRLEERERSISEKEEALLEGRISQERRSKNEKWFPKEIDH